MLLNLESTGMSRRGHARLQVICTPVRYHSFVKWCRQIANAAGILVDVESMDVRAGGATEAEQAWAHDGSDPKRPHPQQAEYDARLYPAPLEEDCRRRRCA